MIGEKIIKIMSEIKPIEKTELDEEKNYKFAKAEDIIAMVQPLLIKYKVIILPLKVINFSQQGNKVYLTMKYQFIDVESQEKDAIEVEIPGSGYDEKGRAVFAALTGAYRYAMQEVFAIPIVDEVRNDNSKNNNDEINQENNVDDVLNEDGFIDNETPVDIPEVNIEDIDKLFTSEKIA